MTDIRYRGHKNVVHVSEIRSSRNMVCQIFLIVISRIVFKVAHNNAVNCNNMRLTYFRKIVSGWSFEVGP